VKVTHSFSTGQIIWRAVCIGIGGLPILGMLAVPSATASASSRGTGRATVRSCPAPHTRTIHRGFPNPPEKQLPVPNQAPPDSCPLQNSGNNNIMPSIAIHFIFWDPSTLQDGTSSSFSPKYVNLLLRFGHDIGGSGLYANNTQYPGGNGSLTNSVTFGGAVTSADPFPTGTCGSSYSGPDCVSDQSIQDEVQAAQSATPGWNRGLNDLYAVFLPPNEHVCNMVGVSGSDCDAGAGGDFCAFHNNDTFLIGPDIIYSVVLDPKTSKCLAYNDGQAPNGAGDADAAVSIFSHELMESVTDPEAHTSRAWQDDQGSEIGDKCSPAINGVDPSAVFGSPGLDGGHANIELKGDPYIVQSEWSNVAPADQAGYQCVLDGTKNTPTADVTPKAASTDEVVNVGAEFLPPNTSISAFYETGLPPPSPARELICTATTDSLGSLPGSCSGSLPSGADIGNTGAHTVILAGPKGTLAKTKVVVTASKFTGSVSCTMNGSVSANPGLTNSGGSPSTVTVSATLSSCAGTNGTSLTQQGVTLVGGTLSGSLTLPSNSCAALTGSLPALTINAKWTTSGGAIIPSKVKFSGATTTNTSPVTVTFPNQGGTTVTSGSFAGSASNAIAILDQSINTIQAECATSAGVTMVTLTGGNGVSTFAAG
jgi:hypothetical protein